MQKSAQKNLAVIGGGAAGFFCACNAARLNPTWEVHLFERSQKVLAKVKISGGGRCNLTHAFTDISSFLENYPRGKNFLKKSFYTFTPQNTLDWFAARNVQTKTEPDGRIFPASNTSQSIIDCLLKEATKYDVKISLQKQLIQLSCPGDTTHAGADPEKFVLTFQDGETIQVDYVCIACGGFPKAAQFSWLTQTGHSIQEPLPSLFSFNIPQDPVTQLMGISLPNVEARIPVLKVKFSGPLIITHWGLSGPAILKLSAFAARGLAALAYQFDVHIHWLPEMTTDVIRENIVCFSQRSDTQLLQQKNPFGFPNRLWLYFLDKAGIERSTRWRNLQTPLQNKLLQILTGTVFTVKGKTTFKDEFVTCGGISLQEIDGHTMESKLHKGLYFAGEIMDVDGITGGFNFQHAWTSAWCAAAAMTKAANETV